MEKVRVECDAGVAVAVVVIDSPPVNAPGDFQVSRADQHAFALRSQKRAGRAQGGAFPQKKGAPQAHRPRRALAIRRPGAVGEAEGDGAAGRHGGRG